MKIPTKIFLQSLFLILLFSLNIYGAELAYDKFSNWSSNGYSRDDGYRWSLLIQGKKDSKKTYDFGNALANKPVDISFQMQWFQSGKGGWENSGSKQDYFKVYCNGIQKVNDTFSGDASDWKNYNLTCNTDNNGELTLKFYANSTYWEEYVLIDNVIIINLAYFICIQTYINLKLGIIINKRNKFLRVTMTIYKQ